MFEPARQAAAHVLVDDITSPVLSENDSHHLRSVLRLRPGEDVSVTDGRGGWRPCVWEGAGSIAPCAEVVRTAAPEPSLCVAFTPVKGERSEWAVQKLAELGIDRIRLFESERSVVRWDERRAATQIERLRRVAQQALMQSRGLWMPTVEWEPDWTSIAGVAGAAIADPEGDALGAAVRTVLVGPEGGWSPSELSSLPAPLVRLGNTVLRTETAAVAAGALLTSMRYGLIAPASTDQR